MPVHSVVILTSIAVAVTAMLITFFIYQQIKAADRVAKMYEQRLAKREVVIPGVRRSPYVGTPTTWAASIASGNSDTSSSATCD